MATTNKDVANSWLHPWLQVAEEDKNIKIEYEREKLAVRDMKMLLIFLEATMDNSFSDQDKAYFEENREEWLESIKVLREYISSNLT